MRQSLYILNSTGSKISDAELALLGLPANEMLFTVKPRSLRYRAQKLANARREWVYVRDDISGKEWAYLPKLPSSY